MLAPAMSRQKPRTLVASAFLLALACQPLGRSDRRDGPAIELGAAAPVAEFTITPCLDSPELEGLVSKAQIIADVTLTAGDPRAEVGGFIISGDGRRRFDVTVGHPRRVDFSLDATGPWNGHSGLRCADPVPVRFELEAPDPTAKLAIRWEASFEVTQPQIVLCRESLSGTATLRIDAAPPP
jgi:hypothetical protein